MEQTENSMDNMDQSTQSTQSMVQITPDIQDDDWFESIPSQGQGSEVDDEEQLQNKKRKEEHLTDKTTTAKASEMHCQ